jgi:cell division protein FtsB
LKVWEYDRQLQQQKEVTRKLEIRNAGLDAEVRDLKQGYDAIEERARFEFGMVRQGRAKFRADPGEGSREITQIKASTAVVISLLLR